MGCAVLLLFWLGGFIIFNKYIKSYKTDMNVHTDAVAVLTGGRNRIAEAVKIYNSGMADKLIISGVGTNVKLKDLERQNHVKILRNPENVILGDEATNTIENAIEVGEIIRRGNIRSLRLVTSFYHLPRSEQEILSQNTGVVIVLHPVYSDYVSSKWWKKWGSFKLIASEYHKFIFVYLEKFVIKLQERN